MQTIENAQLAAVTGGTARSTTPPGLGNVNNWFNGQLGNLPKLPSTIPSKPRWKYPPIFPTKPANTGFNPFPQRGPHRDP